MIFYNFQTMISSFIGSPPTPDTTRKFISNLQFLIGHDQKKVYGRATQIQIVNEVDDFTLVDQQGQKFSIFCSIEKFKKFAPGVYLLFKLAKHLLLMFLIISIISLVQMLLLLKSPFYKGYENIVRINLLRLTVASLMPEDYNAYIVFDILIIMIVATFLIYWSQKIRIFADESNHNNKLPSYLTVQIDNVQSDFSEEKLIQHLKVHQGIQSQQVYTARNYGRFLKHYIKLTQLAIDLRILFQLFYQYEPDQKVKESSIILKKFLDLRNIYCSIKSEKFNQKKYRPKTVFIVLKSYQDRNKLLENQTTYIPCLSETKQNQQKQKSYQFRACQVEPEAIAWENIGISLSNYFVRAFLVFTLLIFVTLFGIILIFTLQILQTASIGDAYYFHEQKLKGRFLQVINTGEPNQPDYGKMTALIILTPLAIFLCKKVIMALLSHSVHFRKYPSEVSRIKSQTITLTVFYFSVIGVLHLFLYLKVNKESGDSLSIYQLLQPLITKAFKITEYSPASIHLYDDYSLDWYKQSTFFITLICSTSFNLSHFIKFVINLISYKIQKWSALKQKTLYGVRKCLKGIDLHMQYINASLVVITYFAMLYGACMPLTIVFSFINILVLFYFTKWSFIKYGKKPMRLGHSINRTVTNLLLIGVFIHCLMAPIFLCAEGIGKNNSHFSYINQQDHDKPVIKQTPLSVAQRYQKLGPIYLTIGSIVMAYMLGRKPFRKFCWPKIKQKFFSQFNSSKKIQKQGYFGLYPSYSMHNTEKYGEVLKNVYLMNQIEGKRKTIKLSPSMKIIMSPANNSNKSNKTIKTKEKVTIFEELLEINEKYLDRSKYPQIYKQINQIKDQVCDNENERLSEFLQTEDRVVMNDQQNQALEKVRQFLN